MLNRSCLSTKLSEFLFIELKEETIKNIFKLELNKTVSFPINSRELVSEVKEKPSFDNLSVEMIIEGMFYIIGCDESFNYCKDYINIIEKNPWTLDMIKKAIGKYVKIKSFKEAYILLRALYSIENSEEAYNNLLVCAKQVADNDKMLVEEYKILIEEGKKRKLSLAYLHESIFYYNEAQYTEALDSLNLYFAQGGKTDIEVERYREELKDFSSIEKGKEKVVEDPKMALEFLLPLLEKFENNPFIYYYIAMAYRNLGLYEKAVYYLNDALEIDKDIVEIFNELGLNYACLNNYDTAIAYFTKAFEATNDISICINLIMCYLNKGDRNKSKHYLDIAKKINAEDEDVKQLEKMLKG